jgi:predicted Zn-dependent protease
MSDPRIFENNLVKIVAAVAFLIFAYFAIQVFSSAYSNNLAEQMNGGARAMNNQYMERIADTTDAYAALKLGFNFSKSQNFDLANDAFTKSTELDPGYRDAWVLKGYSEIKLNQPQNAIDSLKKAETLDSINPETYQYLAVAYKQIGDTDSAQKAQEKYDFLTNVK